MDIKCTPVNGWSIDKIPDHAPWCGRQSLSSRSEELGAFYYFETMYIGYV